MSVVKELVIQTVVDPAGAAKRLLTYDFESRALWTALALACVLNTIVFFLADVLFPITPQPGVPNIGSPVVFAALLFGMMALSISCLFWAGRYMKGAARFEDILQLATWLQFMRFALQIAALILMLFLPALASIGVMLASIYSIWILLKFVDVAEGFDNLGRSLATLALTLLGTTVGILLLSSFVGVTILGMN